MKKLILAVAAFSVFALVSFTSTYNESNSFQSQCTNISDIQLNATQNTFTGDVTFTWNNSALVHSLTLTYDSKIEVRSGSGCPNTITNGAYSIDVFHDSSYFIKYGVGGGSFGSNCFEYRIVIQGYNKAIPYCYSATPWIPFP